MDFITFQDRFSDERKCENYLIQTRWPDGFKCPECGHDEVYDMRHRAVFQCRQCGKQVYWKVGTLFENTKLPLRKWFWAIFLMAESKHGISRKELERKLDVHYKTATRMANRIQKVMGLEESQKFLEKLIELDEADFHSKGSGTDRSNSSGPKPVFVATEVRKRKKESGEHISRDTYMNCAFMEVTQKGDAISARQFLRQHVKKGAKVNTDGGRCFVGVPRSDYDHESTVLGTAERASDVLPWVHIVISNAKRFLNGTFHSVSYERLQDYLNEFCYRLNRRWKNNSFDRLMKAAINPAIASQAREAVS